MMSASMQGALAFQKGLGCVHSLSHALGGADPRLHHGTLNAVFLPAVIRFNAAADSMRREQRLARMAEAMGLPPGDHEDGESVARAVADMSARLGLPTGLAAMGVTEDLFERVIDNALVDHCHATNPRLASRDDYRQMLAASL
jgi:4-hydroxybutyrate dehydrogenase